jgi:Glycosyltransferases, probably involved in cell wall biogenesis
MLASTITLLEALVLIGTVLWITQYSISRRAHAYERPSSVNQQINQLPKVSIIIPAYREKRQSIEKTLDSLSSQNYPRNLMEVLVVVDRDDAHTLNETLKGCGNVPKFVKYQGNNQRECRS